MRFCWNVEKSALNDLTAHPEGANEGGMFFGTSNHLSVWYNLDTGASA